MVGDSVAVSYTHLDVYKRQEEGRSFQEKGYYAFTSDFFRYPTSSSTKSSRKMVQLNRKGREEPERISSSRLEFMPRSMRE